MRIISFNVNGIRSMCKKIKTGEKTATSPEKSVISSLLKEQNPDIICFQEIKADDGAELEHFTLDYPYMYVNHSKIKKGYSGVAILSKHKPKMVNINLSRFSEEQIGYYKGRDFCQEGRLITLEYDNYCVINCYTPNAKPELARIEDRIDWDILFRNYIKQLEISTKKPVIVVGDLNCAHQEIDLHSPKTNHKSAGFSPKEREGFTNLLATADLIDTFRELHPTEKKYSWWSNFANARERDIGWRIDYVLVSKSLKDRVKESNILKEYYGSDHCPVICDIDI